MSIIYVASIGQSAATKYHYWQDAKKRFNYSESVLICSSQLVDKVSKFLDKNTNLIPIENAFYGNDDYKKYVKAIVKQVMDIVAFYENNGQIIDEIIVNTSGGTEKMSCIIKDAVDVLKKLFPFVTHVYSGNYGYETIYTIKPDINIDEIIENFLPSKVEASIKTIDNDEHQQIDVESNSKLIKKKKKKKTQKATKEHNDERNQKRKEKRQAKREEKELLRQEKHLIHLYQHSASSCFSYLLEGLFGGK